MRRLDENGAITIVALWTVAILSILALGLSFRTGIDLKIERFHLEQVQARALARSGVYRAVAELMDDLSASPVDHLGEAWCRNPEAFQDVPLGAGGYRVGYPEDGGLFPAASGDAFWTDAGWTFGVADEERKINVNRITVDAHAALGRLGLEVPLLGEPVPGPVARAELSPETFPQLFPSIFLAEDVDPAKLALAQSYLTAYGDGRVNVNTVSGEVLAVLGMSKGLADRILAFRAGPDLLPGTGDDVPFPDVGSIGDLLRAHGGLSPQEAADLSYFIRTDLLTVSSHFFRIESIGFVDEHRVARKLSVVVERTDDGKGVVRYWFEG